MKKVIRLTESDLINIIKKVIKEQEEDKFSKFIGRSVKLTNKMYNNYVINNTIEDIVPAGENRVVVQFQKTNIPQDPNGSTKRASLYIDCEDEYLWWGCSKLYPGECTKTDSIGDFIYWSNPELVTEIQDIICPHKSIQPS